MLTNQPPNPSFDFERLKKVIAELEQAKKVLDIEEKEQKEKKAQEAVLRFAAPSIDPTKLPVVSPLIKKLQEDVFPTIVPIGGAILNAGFSLFNSGILNTKQKDELAGIGQNIISLPHQLMTGKTDFMGVLTGLTDGFKALGKFFINNPEVMVKVGTTILPEVLPCGGFLANALNSDLVQDTMGAVAKKALGLLSEQFKKLDDMLEDKAKSVLEAPQRG